MKIEILKQFTGVVCVLAAAVTFVVFAFEFNGELIEPAVLGALAIFASEVLQFSGGLGGQVGGVLVGFTPSRANPTKKSQRRAHVASACAGTAKLQFASAYAAIFSVYISRRLDQKRMRQRIFIVYSHKNKEKAQELSEELRSLGFNPWFDQQELLPGQKWQEAIKQAIEDSAIALYLVSKNTEKSKGFISNEMKAAMQVLRARSDTYSPVIPVLLEESALPEELTNVHAVKYYEESGRENLNRGLKRIFETAT